VTGICVGLGGFFLADTPKSGGMGAVMFLLVPVCAGFAIAMVTRQPDTGWTAMLLAAFITLSFLAAFKFEGLLCAVLAFPVLAFPVLAVGLSIGAGMGHLFRRHVVERLRHQITGVTIIFALTPAIILASHRGNACSRQGASRDSVHLRFS
jgi:cell division protein FtsW (lipid II flippase)